MVGLQGLNLRPPDKKSDRFVLFMRLSADRKDFSTVIWTLFSRAIHRYIEQQSRVSALIDRHEKNALISLY